MKKLSGAILLSVFFVLYIVCTPSLSATGQEADADFRNVKWGMSMEKVQEHETVQLSEVGDGRETSMIGETEVGGKECLLVYVFLDGKLMQGFYSFTSTHSDSNQYYYDFKEIENLLKEKYGKPVQEISNISKYTSAEHIGISVLSGRASFQTKRNVKNGNFIRHTLRAGDGNIFVDGPIHAIAYTSYANNAIWDEYKKGIAKQGL